MPDDKRAKQRSRIILGLALLTTVCTTVLAFRVIPHLSDLAKFRQEQASLANLSPFDAEKRDINPDYVAWLKIDDTNVDFPVVRGDDNEKYLHTTFRGEENIVGAIFMDYRCRGEDMPHILIYGHDASDPDKTPLMFGGLKKFGNEEYLAEHSTILYIENGILSEFEIFSARLSTIEDRAYTLDFGEADSFAEFLANIGAPPEATQIITLSTCYGNNPEARVIVQGALKRTIPVEVEHTETGGWAMIQPQE